MANMNSKKIMIKISKDTGETLIETDGFDGFSCLDATKSLQEKLGTTIFDENKEEIYNDNNLHINEVSS
jgi:hypothetical protein